MILKDLQAYLYCKNESHVRIFLSGPNAMNFTLLFAILKERLNLEFGDNKITLKKFKKTKNGLKVCIFHLLESFASKVNQKDKIIRTLLRKHCVCKKQQAITVGFIKTEGNNRGNEE